MILHLVKRNQGLLDVFFFAITFDHGAVRYQIWLDLVVVRAWLVTHGFKDLLGLRHAEASYTAVKQTIVSDVVGGNLRICLLFFHHLVVEIDWLVKHESLWVGFDHCSVKDRVQFDFVEMHILPDFFSLFKLAILYTCIKQTSVGDCIWDKFCLQHFSEYGKGLLQHISRPIGLNKNTESDWTWLKHLIWLPPSHLWNAFHLSKKKDCSVKISKSDTHIKQAVVKDFIWWISELIGMSLHLTEKAKSTAGIIVLLAYKPSLTIVIRVLPPVIELWKGLPILVIRLNTFNKCAASIVVRLNTFWPHQGKQAPRSILVVAPYAHIN